MKHEELKALVLRTKGKLESKDQNLPDTTNNTDTFSHTSVEEDEMPYPGSSYNCDAGTGDGPEYGSHYHKTAGDKDTTTSADQVNPSLFTKALGLPFKALAPFVNSGNPYIAGGATGIAGAGAAWAGSELYNKFLAERYKKLPSNAVAAGGGLLSGLLGAYISTDGFRG